MKSVRFRIILLIIVGVLIVAVYPVLGNLVATIVQEWIGEDVHPLVVLVLFIALSALAVYYGMTQYIKPTESASTSGTDQRNRTAMLAKVRQTWITGLLDQSIAKDARIALGLQAHPDAVIDPIDLVVQRPNFSPQPLQPGTTIIDVYDYLTGALLILGAPGAGKTTLLLELTRDLLTRADGDPDHPIPVVFPLSSWATERKSLDAWLIDELVLRYQIPRAIAQRWIDDDAILPLLDGLDEVAPDHRNACAEAINRYRQTRGMQPLVVSSRIKDYEVLTTRLNLHGAIVAQPLSREQVRAYLRAVDIPAIPRADSSLWDLLDTPLMLTVAALAYAGQPFDALATADPIAAQQQLFAAYIDRMFARNNPQRPFTDAETRHYLAFLAYQLQQHNQTTLYLEQMQPDWLSPPQRQRWRIFVRYIVGLAGWLVGELGFGLAFGLRYGLVGGLSAGLIGGLVGSLGSWLVFGLDNEQRSTIDPTEAVRWSSREAQLTFIKGLRSSLVIGVGFALGLRLTFGLFYGLDFGLRDVLLGCLVSVLVFGLINGLIGGLSEQTIEQKTLPNQGIQLSGINALLVGVSFGLVVGVGFGLAGWLVFGLSNVLRDGVGLGLVIGLVIGMASGLLYGGLAFIQHYLLRLLLIRNGSIPRRLVPFLNYAIQRIFLRRVGGGYLFIHRLLLEHFAAQYEQDQAGKLPATQ